MRRIFVSIVLVVVMVWVAGLVSSSYAAPQVYTLKYATFSNPGMKSYAKLEQYCKEVEKRTNGRVKLQLYPGGTLTPAQFTYNAVLDGVADVGHLVFSYSRGTFPLIEILDMPLGSRSGSLSTHMMNAWYKHFKPKELEELKVLFLTGLGPNIIHTKKPVNSLANLKGMKIRTTGLGEKVISALGGVPVGMAMPETYDAIQKGVTQGVLAPMEALYNWKFAEVVKYTTPLYGANSSPCLAMVMSKKKWDSLPADIRQIWDTFNEEWIGVIAKMYDEQDAEGEAFAKTKGVKVLSLSKEDQAKCAVAVKPILDNYVKRMKTKGLPGEQSVKFCLDYIKARQK
ncbi:MAG: 2,3-diketo-L-gulonate-binding periplasmic protein YiaO precursor [Syntrophorhabdaceae bacterium PtaU1.Bin034]|jgi:TRAP-type C4-dicarboxylate transport system substrate-binding protein|nr:MAG: 2,3-diketo-L-gulonate-binding periplasmic protein YiaO precursor [Syntrophorhabdaceae bacterium PtaU1.Bin034]